MSASTSQDSHKNHQRLGLDVLLFSTREVLKSGRAIVCGLLLVTIISGLLPAAMATAGKLVVNSAALILQTRGTCGIKAVAAALTIQLIILVAAVTLGQIGTLLNGILGRRLALNISGGVMAKLATLDCRFYEQPHFYDMIFRAQSQSSYKPLIIVTEAGSVICGLITFVSMGALITLFDCRLFGAMLLVCLPLLLVQIKYGRENYRLQYGRTEDARLAGYLSGLMLRKDYISEIFSLGLWKYLWDKWHRASNKILEQDMRLGIRRTYAETAASIILSLSTVTATGYIIYRSVTGTAQLSIGDIVMYSGAFAGGIAALRPVMTGIAGIYENALFVRDLMEFNRLRGRIEIQTTGKEMPERIDSIELQNISFKYPGNQRYVLADVSTVFHRGRSTLIVGSNGAGKSTLIKLLLRLYDPTEGRILINGVDIRDFRVDSLRRSVGVIFQEFIRFAFSAGQNIGCSDVAAIQNTERLRAAAIAANADSLIEALPGKYETILSRLFKEGHELSLGQWQRIALARLFFRDSPVLIFDEPTASLDIETEAHLLGRIERLAKERLCILISHRMCRANIADRILVLRGGRIAESAGYGELLAGNGRFAEA